MQPASTGMILAVAVLGLSIPAGAAQRTARLEYTRAPEAAECPEARAVQNAIAARLGYNPFRPDAPLLITVDVSRQNGSFRALIALRQGAGGPPRSRELTSSASDCAELASAMELAVSIAIDPLDATRPPPDAAPEAIVPPRRVATAPPERVASPPPPAPAPVLSSHAPEPAKWGAAVGLLGAIGVAPSVSAGFLLEGRLRWPRVSLGLEGRADLPTRAPLLGGSVWSSLLGASLSACVHFGPVGACGVVAGGALRTSAEGFAQTSSVWSPHVAAGARAGVELALSPRWALRAQAELLARLVRVTLTVDGQDAWVSAPISGSLALLAVAAF